MLRLSSNEERVSKGRSVGRTVKKNISMANLVKTLCSKIRTLGRDIIYAIF